jgi:IclR family transcriptional regulator, acetate operon repressor
MRDGGEVHGDRGTPGGRTVQSVDRAVTILELLARRGALGVTELAAELGVHKSTASRLVAALEQRDLVGQTHVRGKFELGVGLVRLAGATSARLDLVQQARPVARLLASRTGETVNLAVLGQRAALYVDQVVGPGTTPSYNWVGQHIPLHATSNGKVLLSELPEDELAAAVGDLTPYTARTVRDLRALRAELADVRRAGRAVASDELDIGLTAVAAPVRNLHGEICASLSVSGPTFRLGAARVEELAPLVRQAAVDVSARMGWHPAATC